MDWGLLLGMERGHLQWELLRDHTACHVGVHSCKRLSNERLRGLREHTEVHLLRDLSLLVDWL